MRALFGPTVGAYVYTGDRHHPTKAATIPAETVAGVVAFKERALRTHTAHAYLVVKYPVRAYLVYCTYDY